MFQYFIVNEETHSCTNYNKRQADIATTRIILIHEVDCQTVRLLYPHVCVVPSMALFGVGVRALMPTDTGMEHVIRSLAR